MHCNKKRSALPKLNRNPTDIKIRSFAYCLKAEFIHRLGRRVANRTLLAIVRDHGQFPMSKDSVVFVKDRANNTGRPSSPNMIKNEEHFSRDVSSIRQ